MNAKPNLFIPGFPKCGTSSLHSMLIQHLDITEGKRKEPHTYSWDSRYRNRSKYFRETNITNKTKYFLDSSSSYVVSKIAINRILSDTPEAKFVIILRDPVERIVSHFNWLSKLGLINSTFQDEIRIHGNEKFNFRNHYKGNYKAYVDFSMYGEHLQFLMSKVDKSKLFFIFFEELTTSWKRISVNLGNFLELDLSMIELERKNATATIGRVEPKKVLKGWNKWRRRIIRELNGEPRTIKVKNPVYNEVAREDVESILFPYLEKDLLKVVQLGLFSPLWRSKIL